MKKSVIARWIALAILICCIYAVALFCLASNFNKETMEKAGVFGDSFGALTSFFSALAFIGVVLTLYYQTQEFNRQKKDEEENRKELIKQGFENSFFQMLHLHNQIVDNISFHLEKDDKTVYGRVAIKEMQLELNEMFKAEEKRQHMTTHHIPEVFNQFYYKKGYQLAHYFRFLYNIFRFLSESDIENKELYTRLARAQISNQELYILYYNAYTNRGENFKKYIAEFELMDNLPTIELFRELDKNLIPNAGFKTKF
ncbi:putative phage abortive infection protein [Kosakonia oryzendophytica]|uniref:putative phage abortive infection protein n=1 Tax=Kosakonia oryzendophytica TaxID=1005665 RepID=UPI003D3291CD